MVGHYDLRLVALSILISIFAAYAALDLAGRVTSASRGARAAWLAGGSFALGTGIWAMHYVGMTAYKLPIPVAYDWPTVLASLLAAVLASAVALFAVSRATLTTTTCLTAGIIMGGGIAAMHYIGMAAMRLAAMCSYSPALVALSILLAIAISSVAIYMVFSLRETAVARGSLKIGGAVVLGLAIPVMHYVGMAAVTFASMPFVHGSLARAVPISSLGLASIALITVMLLGIAVYSSAADRRFYLQTQLLADNRSQVQTIFDNLQEGVVVLDRNRQIVQMNQSAHRMLGMPELAGLSSYGGATFDVTLRDGTPVPVERWPSTLALNGEFTQNCELEVHRRQTGDSLIVEVGTAPIRDRSGELSHVIISYRDVTQPKQVDDARIRLAAIVESSDDAIIGKDDKGVITSWNQGAEHIFGYTAAEMIGQSVRCLLPVDRLHEEDEILDRIRHGSTVEHIETIRRCKNGQFIHVSLSISPIRDATGKIIGASKIARNITDKKQLESRLFESQKMEAIGQLTGGIAHDFNNLLSIVIGNLDLLERLVPGNPSALKRVQTAQRAANRGADLTRRMLAFSRREQLHPTCTRIEEPIQNTLELAARALGPEIRITTHFDPALPPLLVDVASLENALLNLIVNARDAMPNGGDLTISTRLAYINEEFDSHLSSDLKPGRYICVSVSDTGEGMSRQTLDRAFEPFFTTKDRGKGTGLGLAMVYGFFKQSGGTVRIYSELGYGTTVSFYLPLSELAPTPPAPDRAASEPASGAATILLVDDETDLIEIAVAYLTEIGHVVYVAKDGAQALTQLHNHPDIELMVTDIIMPGGMNGVELSRRAIELLPRLRVIYCSGFPADALVERNLPPVDGALLLKPYQRSELITLIRQTLHRPQPVVSQPLVSQSIVQPEPAA